MPRKSRRPATRPGRRARKRDSRPNIYIAPSETDESEAEAGPDGAHPAEVAVAPRSQRTRTRLSRRLRGRRASLRNTLYTQYLTQELRKLGILVTGMAVVLGVLTVVLR